MLPKVADEPTKSWLPLSICNAALGAITPPAFHLSPVAPALANSIVPVNPAKPVIVVFRAVVLAAKFNLSRPEPVKVFASVVVPEVLVLFNNSVEPEPITTAPVLIPFWVVFTVAVKVPELLLMVVPPV